MCLYFANENKMEKKKEKKSRRMGVKKEKKKKAHLSTRFSPK
jgi:hypothetical protein